MNYSLIGSYGLQMTLTLLLVLGAWTLKVAMSNADTVTWYKSNAVRIAISVVLCWLISAALVIVPGIPVVLGGLGFNADQGTAGIALALSGFIIKKTAAGDKPIQLN